MSVNGVGDDISAKAMQAPRGDDPDLASRTLRKLLEGAPDRLDLLHALAVTELRRSNPAEAWQITMHGQQIAEARRDETAGVVMPQLVLVRAAACEDLFDAAGAEACLGRGPEARDRGAPPLACAPLGERHEGRRVGAHGQNLGPP